MNGRYRDISWISPKLMVAASTIDGLGVFTKASISRREVVIIWGGAVFTRHEVETGSGKQHTLVGISESLYLGTPAEAALTLDDYMNHSCLSNIGMEDEVTLVAKRAIEPGEESVSY